MAVTKKTRYITVMAMLVALSIVLVGVIHFPIFPSAAFLEYDPADIPILIGTFAFGPLAGLILTLLVSVIQGFTVSAHSGIYGVLMHFFATGAFVLVAGNIYKRRKNRTSAIIALIVGVIVMVGVMVILNLLITPYFMGAPRAAVKAMLIPIIIPFNFIKAGANALVTFLVYKPISRLIHRKDTADSAQGV